MGKLETAIDNARKELLTWAGVKKVDTRGELKNKPGNVVEIDFDVFHEVKSGTTWSTKICYIDTTDYTYKWHYGGVQPDENTFKAKLDAILPSIKSDLNLDFIYPEYIELIYKHAKLIGIKKTTAMEKEIIFAYEDDEGNIKYKVDS